MLLQLVLNNLFSWRKKNCLKVLGVGGLKCVVPFQLTAENPGTKPLKHAVKMLKESDKSMIMFPSGSRHSAEMKGGVAVIA